MTKNIVYRANQVAFSPDNANNDYPVSRAALFGELWVYFALKPGLPSVLTGVEFAGVR